MDKPYVAGGLTLSEDWRTAGADAFSLEAHPGVTNPVIDKTHVTGGVDVAEADTYVADPFVVKDGDTYYMFYEYYWTPGGVGVSNIHYSTSADGLTWTYGGVALANPIYSYPFVFKVDGEWWMTPSQKTPGVNWPVTLYRAYSFPTGWEKYLDLIPSTLGDLRDPTPFRWGDYWYIFTGDKATNELRLFYAPYLYGNTYAEHPSSPILTGLDQFRPGGRPILRAAAVDLMIQNDSPIYGRQVRCFRLTNLTPTTCTVAELETSPLLDASGVEDSWNQDGMHTLDRIDASLSIVDGKIHGPPEVYAIGIYRDVAEE